MGRAEGVVVAFRAPGEARQAAALAQGLDPVAATGQDLVRIGLVADVPDHAVGGGVEHVVQGSGQLHHAQAGAQVPSGHGDGLDGRGAQLVRDLTDLLTRECAQVGRSLDLVQQRCGLGHGFNAPPERETSTSAV